MNSTRDFYVAVFDMLVSEAQIPNGKYISLDRDAFCKHFTEGGTEWRFCGDLGFGGKFYRGCNGYTHYVGYYPEDRNTAREKLVARLNSKIIELDNQFLP